MTLKKYATVKTFQLLKRKPIKKELTFTTYAQLPYAEEMALMSDIFEIGSIGASVYKPGNASIEHTAEIMSETERKNAPSKKDIKDMLAVLKDFGILATPPMFSTHAEMDTYRRAAITAAMA